MAWKRIPLLVGLDNPSGMVFHKNRLIVIDGSRILSIDDRGDYDILFKWTDFPLPPKRLLRIAASPVDGAIYISDFGSPEQAPKTLSQESFSLEARKSLSPRISRVSYRFRRNAFRRV